MLVIKLKKGNYILDGGEDIIEVPKKCYAEKFSSLEEAEKFIREKWIDGIIEEYK